VNSTVWKGLTGVSLSGVKVSRFGVAIMIVPPGVGHPLQFGEVAGDVVEVLDHLERHAQRDRVVGQGQLPELGLHHLDGGVGGAVDGPGVGHRPLVEVGADHPVGAGGTQQFEAVPLATAGVETAT
jgi:hypothetical protein